MIKTKLKKDDQVVVLTGSDKGKRGKILYIDRKNGRVIVEGINKKTKFMKANSENPKGGAIQIEYPINISNVLYFSEKEKKGVRLNSKHKEQAKKK